MTKKNWVKFDSLNPKINKDHKKRLLQSGRWLLLILALIFCQFNRSFGQSYPRGTVLENQTFQSKALGRSMKFSIYLPPNYDKGKRYYNVIYLLHGYTGNNTDWVRLGDAAYSADSLTAVNAIPPFIMVMPNAKNSWYVDSPDGSGYGNYESAIVEDLVNYIDQHYHVIPGRNGRAVAGLSMGGFGALHLAFKYPDKFRMAASLSGALIKSTPEQTDYFEGSFGKPFDATLFNKANPFNLVSNLKKFDASLPVYITVGDDDGYGFYTGATRLYAKLHDAKLPAQLRITNGAHTWSVWSRGLKRVLQYFGDHFKHQY